MGNIFSIILIIFALFMQNTLLYADATEVGSISEMEATLAQMYSEVDQNDITTGILFGSEVTYTDFSKYRGSNEDSVLNSLDFSQIYLDLYKFDQVSSQLPDLEALEENYTSYINENDAFPISILHYNYNILDTTAYNNGEFYYDSLTYNKFIPSQGNDSIPLIEDKLFSASVLRNMIIGQNLNFIFTNEFIFTNTNLTISHFEVDFDNGAGFLTVNLNSNISVNYSNSGEKEIKINTYFTDPAIMLSSNFKVNINAEDIPVPAPPNEFSIVVDAVEGNKSTSSGTAYIRYGSGNVSLIKPVIVVEGFDPKNERGFKELFDILNTENLADELYDDGYDLIILNFIDGSDYIQNNAEVLRELIHEVNDRTPAGRENVIIGASMGGLVSRYALALMEATPGEDHETRLFISYDSPQLGANIPLSVQFFAKHLERLNDKAIKQLNSPAAKQMLLYHHINSDDDGTPSTLRDELISDLAAIGNWPDSPSLRKVAVSNGSGNQLNFNGGDLMVKCSIDNKKIFGPALVTRYKLSYKLRAINDTKTTVFEGSIKHQVRVPDVVPFTWKWQTISFTPWDEDVTCEQLLDNAPGGTRNTFQETAESFVDGVRIPWWPYNLLSFGDATVYHEDHCFIPTHSALGIETNDAHYNVHEDPNPHANSYFDYVYFPASVSDNQEHIVSITEENKRWFIDEIKGTPVTFMNVYDNENIINTTLAVDGVNNSISSGASIPLATNANYTMRTNHKTIDGHNWMHHDWNYLAKSFKLYDSLHTEPNIDVQKAVFLDYDSCTINNSFGTIEGLHIHDPWYRDSTGVQPDAMRPLSEVAPDMMYEIFLDQNLNQGKPEYSVYAENEIPAPVHGETIPWYFSGWSSSGADLEDASAETTAVVFRGKNAQITANYKGHLTTSIPYQADTKNQRRLVQDGDDWIMVYEDAGDIWLTASNDQGASWQEEIKLNMRNGCASNPSVSNILSGQFYMITWLEENASSDTELHLQTMRFPLAYGWTGSPYGTQQEDGINHRIFDQSSNGEPDEEARPVIYMEWVNQDILATLASECASNGIRMSKILFEEDGPFPSVVDLEDAEAITVGLGYPNLNVDPNKLGFTRVISTSQYDKFPNVISVPPSYGGAAKTYIYYAQSLGYNSKIYQYDIDASSSSYTTLPSEFAGILSLQAAAWPQNATIALAVRTSASIGGPNVVVYERPSYGGLPQIKDVYRGYDHPSIMIKEYGGFNSSGADHLLMMENTSDNWYKSDGSNLTSIGTDVSGVSMRPSFASGDNRVMYTKTYSELPALIKKYSGSGALLKGSISGLDVEACRYWKNSKGIEQKSILDFSGVEVELVDSLETDAVLAAFKILSFGEDGLLVSQPDTMVTSFAVEVMREGKIISSYQTSVWTRLSTRSMPDVKTGDVLLFGLDEKFERLWDFRILTASQSGLSKYKITEQVSDSLKLIDGSVSVYPNPFNPVTHFYVALPEVSEVELRIYNTLGQMIYHLHKGELPAGNNKIPFNGTALSSGIYFYSLKIADNVQSGKLMLMK